MSHKKIKIFEINIDQLTMVETVSLIAKWVISDERLSRYVVTPNVDHIVNLKTNNQFKLSYDSASLVVADGKPLVLASKLLGKPLPETVPGSDLVPNLFCAFQSHYKKTLKVFLLGAMPGVAEVAAANIKKNWPLVEVVGVYSPKIGFEKNDFYSKEICEKVSRTNADIVIFGVGSPKQEIWCCEYASRLNVKCILCVGATIDFIAGEKTRAPLWLRKIGLEWLHRLFSEPKRLFKRYFIDALIFPILFINEWKIILFEKKLYENGKS